MGDGVCNHGGFALKLKIVSNGQRVQGTRIILDGREITEVKDFQLVQVPEGQDIPLSDRMYVLKLELFVSLGDAE